MPGQMPGHLAIQIPSKVVITDGVPDDHHRGADQHDQGRRCREHTRPGPDLRCDLVPGDHEPKRHLEQDEGKCELQKPQNSDGKMPLQLERPHLAGAYACDEQKKSQADHRDECRPFWNDDLDFARHVSCRTSEQPLLAYAVIRSFLLRPAPRSAAESMPAQTGVKGDRAPWPPALGSMPSGCLRSGSPVPRVSQTR